MDFAGSVMSDRQSLAPEVSLTPRFQANQRSGLGLTLTVFRTMEKEP